MTFPWTMRLALVCSSLGFVACSSTADHADAAEDDRPATDVPALADSAHDAPASVDVVQPTDAGTDTGMDTGLDVPAIPDDETDAGGATDAGPDVAIPTDSGVDVVAPMDTPMGMDTVVVVDTGVDTGVAMDTGVDVAVLDTGVDVGIDAGPPLDTGVDVQPDLQDTGPIDGPPCILPNGSTCLTGYTCGLTCASGPHTMCLCGPTGVFISCTPPCPAVDAGTDTGVDVVYATPGAVRQIGPLSASMVTIPTPTLEWVSDPVSTGAAIDICADRACGTVVAHVTSSSISSTHAPALTPGHMYYWRVRGTNGPALGPQSPVWEFFVPQQPAVVPAASRADTYWGTIPDFNGDGYADLAIGTPGDSGGTGRVDVYYGGPTGVVTGAAPTLRITPPADATASSFGASVACAGDFNGDGYADAIVGNAVGRFYVYLGGPAGLAATPAVDESQLVEATFGAPVAGIGDFNHDGYGDVVVGAPTAGIVTFYYGAALAAGVALSLGETRLTGSVLAFGTSIAGAGDIDGDRYADVVVGAPNLGTTAAPGGIFVLHGEAFGVPSPGPVAISPAPNASFGTAVAGAGDVNGDGLADLVVGEPTGSAAYVLAGPVLGTEVVLGIVAGTVASFGAAVVGLGDVNADGYADVAVGAPAPSGPSASVVLGVAQTSTWVPRVVTAVPSTVPGRYGSVVAGAGDLDGNGIDDLVVTSSSTASGAAAAVWIFPSHGATDWAGSAYASTPYVLATPPSLAGGFGRSIAVGR